MSVRQKSLRPWRRIHHRRRRRRRRIRQGLRQQKKTHRFVRIVEANIHTICNWRHNTSVCPPLPQISATVATVAYAGELPLVQAARGVVASIIYALVRFVFHGETHHPFLPGMITPQPVLVELYHSILLAQGRRWSFPSFRGPESSRVHPIRVGLAFRMFGLNSWLDQASTLGWGQKNNGPFFFMCCILPLNNNCRRWSAASSPGT
jgi:hypothetical protein